MSEQLLAVLKQRLADVSGRETLDAITIRNALKEELQFYVLDFIYHHPDFQSWILYGGSALRVIHGLNRMSEDLDFEVSQEVTEKYLDQLKIEIEKHFRQTYGAVADFLKVNRHAKRGVVLKFHVGDQLRLGHASNFVNVKIDLNHFTFPKQMIERRTMNHGQLSFVILTYKMSVLMASKLAAIFLRGTRGVGDQFYLEKGRDIYDLLWYMEKKIVPNFDYLQAKGIDANDPRVLFEKLTDQMQQVSDENLKNDLRPLFLNQTFTEHWVQNWRRNYAQRIADYKIDKVVRLLKILIQQETRHFLGSMIEFEYHYETERKRRVVIRYLLSEDWIRFKEGNLDIKPDQKLKDMMEFNINQLSGPSIKEKLSQYATLFDRKTENYFKKTNRTVLGDEINTKFIRFGKIAERYNPAEEIALDQSSLLSCELDDLL